MMSGSVVNVTLLLPYCTTMAEFPTLYGSASNGKTKVWSIRVFEQDSRVIIETVYGYEEGKKQTQQRVVTEGKNIGRSNATTALEQAISEARTAWTKKKEEQYAGREEVGDEKVEPAAVAAMAGKSKGIDDQAPLPMLAHDYHKQGNKIIYPCYCQPKLDGTRCISIPLRGLFSRRRKAYPHMEHITAETNRLPSTFVLDGELYSDTLTFQEIVGLVKKETLNAVDEAKQIQIKFHVYDIVMDKPYENRMNILKELFRRNRFQHLVFVETKECKDATEMKTEHDVYVSRGYEGIMLRNRTGLYVQRRSYDLQKYKEFVSEEYTVVDAEQGQGAEDGCVIWVCEISANGRRFSCRPQGSREERQTQYLAREEYIGKKLTVKFQELTDDGIPRFPVGIAFRDYE